MSTKERIERELMSTAGILDNGGELAPLNVEIESGQLRMALTAVNELACAFRDFTVRAPSFDDASLNELRQVASELSTRLNYLLEPIGLVETDENSRVVLLRSNPPRRDARGARRYYELLVRRGELSLARFSKPVGTDRKAIPIEVTREVFYRLADDFARTCVQMG